MSGTRILWMIVGASGASIVGFCLGMHAFGFSARAMFGSRDAAAGVHLSLVIGGMFGWPFLLYRGWRYWFLDCLAIIGIGMFLGLIVSSAGYGMYDDMTPTIVLRGAVYVGGLAMIRAWWMSRTRIARSQPIPAF